MLHTKLTHKSIVLMALLGLLVVGVGADVSGQEKVQTGSKSIGYENVGKIMSEVAGANVDNREQVTEVLNNLFNALAEHLKEKGVPEHVVGKFLDSADSITTVNQLGLLSKEQLKIEVSNITKNALRKEGEGKVPVSVLEKAGMSKDIVEKLSKKETKEKEVATTVRKMVGQREKEKEKVQEKKGKGDHHNQEIDQDRHNQDQDQDQDHQDQNHNNNQDQDQDQDHNNNHDHNKDHHDQED